MEEKRARTRRSFTEGFKRDAVALVLVAGIAIIEFLVHYHVDWLKERLTHRNNWTPRYPMFWFALGTDQLIPGLSYLVIVGLLVAVAT